MVREREEQSGGECGGVIGVITHKQTAYASHQCKKKKKKHPPPLEHSYFQVAAFPNRRAGDEEPYLSTH